MTSPAPQGQHGGVLVGSSKETLDGERGDTAPSPPPFDEKNAEKRELQADEVEDQLPFAFSKCTSGGF